jgi:hypothetical protein
MLYEARTFEAPNPVVSMADEPLALPAISVVGLGYVGAVSVACYAQLGHRVVGIDLDLGKVEQIAAGASPIVEAGLGEALTDGVVDELITADPNVLDGVLETDITFVCVGTPSRADGTVDLSALKAVAGEIGSALALKSDYHLVVVRSTVPAGTTRQVVLPEIERVSGKRCGRDFGLCFHPEFLREGVAIADFYAPAQDGDRRVRREERRHAGQGLSLDRSAPAAHLDRGRRDGEVRRQHLARREGRLRQRSRQDLPVGRRRQPQGHGHLRPGPEAQSVALLPEARLRVRRLLPAQGRAGPSPASPMPTASRCR